MVTPLAQAGVREVCGPADEADRLCEVVFELTGDARLAQVAGVGATAVWFILIVIAALIATWLSRRVVARYTARLEERTTQRLERDHQRGAITDTQRFRTRRLQRLQAASGVVRGVLAVIIWLTALFLALDLFGVPLQPLLAGAGVVSVVIGFGAQQLVRDVLAGIAMLIEDQYGVGDWIEVEGRFGEVERVGLRSTAFRDVDGVLHHVLNGYMQRIGNLSQQWARATLDVPVSLDADLPAAKALVFTVASDLASDPLWGQDVIGAPEVWGVQEFGPDGIRIRVVIPTKPLRNWDLARQLRERLKIAFDAAGIRMPGQLVDLGGQGAGYPVLSSRFEPTNAPHHGGGGDGGGGDGSSGPRDGGGAARGDRPADPSTADPSKDTTGPIARPGGAHHEHRTSAADDTTDRSHRTVAAAEHTPGPAPGAGADEEEHARQPRDATTELRLRQGPRARPD